MAVLQAVKHNKSNCIYVYHHYKNGPWYSPELAAVIPKEIERNEAVAIAHLGYPNRREEIASRLKEASQLTGLGSIDIAIIRVYYYCCCLEIKYWFTKFFVPTV
jgi:hypothetical protein